MIDEWTNCRCEWSSHECGVAERRNNDTFCAGGSVDRDRPGSTRLYEASLVNSINAEQPPSERMISSNT